MILLDPKNELWCQRQISFHYRIVLLVANQFHYRIVLFAFIDELCCLQ
jgi:hypothetical protein